MDTDDIQTTAYDVIIIGGGLYAIVAAKTYLQVNPEVSLAVIESQGSIGGTWSSERIYPGLTADSPAGAFEFSDMGMAEELGIEVWGDITGNHVCEYLNRYAEKFKVLENVRFLTEATRVERLKPSYEYEAGWNVFTKSILHPEAKEQKLSCKKLIVATGHTSRKVVPALDVSSFKGPVLHSLDIGSKHQLLLSPEIENVTVVGGNKSALEAVHLAIKAHKYVTWLIRGPPSNGPQMLFNARENGHHSNENNTRRVMALLSPRRYLPSTFWYWLLHSGKFPFFYGPSFTAWVWGWVTAKVLNQRPLNSENGRLLKPNGEPPNIFWHSAGIALVHDHMADLMHEIDHGDRIKVIRSEISDTKGNNLTLRNGNEISSDMLVFCTGWEQGHNHLFSPDLLVDLGLPHFPEHSTTEYKSYWEGLDSKYKAMVLSKFPMLARPPPHVSKSYRPSKRSPYRLFRTLVPTRLAAEPRNDRSIVFLGMLQSSLNPTFAEVASLWSVAYLENLFPSPSSSNHHVKTIIRDQLAMDQDVAEMTAFMKCRYRNGKDYPNAILDVQDYIDLFMGDLGLRVDRKRLSMERSVEGGNKKGWFWAWKCWVMEWFEPYLPMDYRGFVEEFLEGEWKKKKNT